MQTRSVHNGLDTAHIQLHTATTRRRCYSARKHSFGCSGETGYLNTSALEGPSVGLNMQWKGLVVPDVSSCQ